VGNGSIVLHEVEVEPWSIVAANSVVLNGTRVPSGGVAMGSPAVVREDKARRELITGGVSAYVARAERYRRELRRLD
jgi:carbonic anhydrase/acetyltransferase-like protein (isoleucine patch superfamily)